MVAPNAAHCSKLIPETWLAGVPGADFPQGQTVGDWERFGDAQTGQLDKANDHLKSSVSIMEKCEVQQDAALATLKPKPWYHPF